MTIQLVDADAMKTGRGGGGKAKGQKYAKYRLAIQKIVPFLKENIKANGTIRAKTEDIKKEMGSEFVTKHTTSIYWGLKYSLFQEGIWVTTGKHTDGSDVLVMRLALPDDKLPESLTKGGDKEYKGDEGSLPEDEKEDEKEPIDEDEDEDEDK
jgi:hypothetical protein